jgi:hypothetical protein
LGLDVEEGNAPIFADLVSAVAKRIKQMRTGGNLI